MRILTLSPEWTLVLDLAAWLFFHLGIGFTLSQIPVAWFHTESRLYRTHAWEKGGEVYDQWLRVKFWKRWIPRGSMLYPNTFSLQHIENYSVAYLERYLAETCRAEVCHWLMVFPGFLFFLWNSGQVGWLMVGYAVLNNLIPIALQRYNRPRVRRLLAAARQRDAEKVLRSTALAPQPVNF